MKQNIKNTFLFSILAQLCLLGANANIQEVNTFIKSIDNINNLNDTLNTNLNNESTHLSLIKSQEISENQIYEIDKLQENNIALIESNQSFTLNDVKQYPYSVELLNRNTDNDFIQNKIINTSILRLDDTLSFIKEVQKEKEIQSEGKIEQISQVNDLSFNIEGSSYFISIILSSIFFILLTYSFFVLRKTKVNFFNINKKLLYKIRLALLNNLIFNMLKASVLYFYLNFIKDIKNIFYSKFHKTLITQSSISA